MVIVVLFNFRLFTSSVKLDEVALTDEWECSNEGVQQLTSILHHNSIYKHMFGNKYFNPVQQMNVSYADGEYENPVYYGNQLSPADVRKLCFGVIIS